LALLLVWPAGFQAAPLTFRVLTYNIHHGEGMDGRFDLERVASVMKSAQPDLIALQEVDVSTARAGGVNQLAALARLMDMHAEFGRAMNYDGGGYGVAVLSRWPILAVENDPLPFAPEREPRTALTVQLRPGPDGPLVRFTSTHFDQGREQETRLEEATRLNELLTREGPPAILGGDLNARPGTGAITIIEEQWTNALAQDLEPTGRPGFIRGDYVLYRPTACWRVIQGTVLDDRVASDHRPVLAVLEWTGLCQ
jgi:endonuclease/exonuclease/phosphatase family metal-dependent hydrolase